MASISEILMAQGRQEAESRRYRAGQWQPLIQHLATLPGQVMQDRQVERMGQEAAFDREQQRAVRGQQLAKGDQELRAGTRAAADEQAMTALLSEPGSLDETGTIVWPKVIASAQQKAPQLIPRLNEAMYKHDEGVAKAAHAAATEARAQAEFDNTQTDRRQVANQQGVRRMIGESIAARGDQPMTPQDARTYQGMALQEGVELPQGVLPEPEEEVSMVIKGPNGRPTRVMVPKSQLRNGGVEEYREPDTGTQPSFSWAKDPKTGDIVRATDAEIRARGLQQPDTADMRNKEAGKRTAARAVDAVKTIGARVITKVGPAQRMDAIKRGAEAVFGNDPEFRTYQDSRMALAGTLAVEQQGSRVSDADVKALWLPMIPDAYRDTSESYKLKWDLINSMRGVTDRQPPLAGGRIRVQGPNGESGTVPAGTAMPPGWKAAP